LQRDAADLYIPSDRIQGDVAGLESDAKRAPGSSQQGFGAGNELDGCKRLDQIVVRSDIQSDDAVLYCVARGQHQDRNVIACGAQVGEQVDAVTIRQTEIQDRSVIDRKGECLPRIDIQRNDVNRESGPLQGGLKDLRDARLVLDDQNDGAGLGTFGNH